MDHSSRIEQVKKALAEQDKDAFLATGGANTYYFSGFHTVSEGNYPMVLIPREGDAQLIVSGLDEDAAAYASTIPLLVPEDGFVDAIKEALPEDADLLVQEDMSVGFYQKLEEHAALMADDDIVSHLRSRKEETEIEHIREAYRLTETSLQETISHIETQENMTESRVAAELEYLMRKNGSAGTAFPTIVATGASSSLPHHSTSDADVGEGPLLFDIGATVNGYRSDMSRTYHIGEPADAFKEVYAAVQTAQEQAESELRAGVQASAVDAAARNVLEEQGYGDAFKHSTGHGVGIDVHESPNISPKNDDVIEEGMVVTIEPGVYLKGDFGVRIEDAYLITETGAERLTEGSRELTILDR